jgi:hypothetical protein
VPEETSLPSSTFALQSVEIPRNHSLCNIAFMEEELAEGEDLQEALNLLNQANASGRYTSEQQQKQTFPLLNDVAAFTAVSPTLAAFTEARPSPPSPACFQQNMTTTSTAQNPVEPLVSDEDPVGSFEGCKFQCMDEDTLQVYEQALIRGK